MHTVIFLKKKEREKRVEVRNVFYFMPFFFLDISTINNTITCIKEKIRCEVIYF